MKTILAIVAVVANSTYAVLSRMVPKSRLDDVIVLHWCHLYRRHGLERPAFIGMDNPPGTVTTNAATDIDWDRFTGNGQWEGNNNTPNITERGFAYFQGTAGDPTTADSTEFETGSWSGATTTSFSRIVTGLTGETSYRVCAYAINSAGTTYGNTITVTTTEAPAPAPTLLTPADESVSDGTEFTWQFNTITGDTQEAFAFRARVGEEFGILESGQDQYVARFSNDGTYYVTGQLNVFETGTWASLPGPSSPPTGNKFDMRFSPDDSQLAIALSVNPRFRAYNTSDWSVKTYDFTFTDWVYKVCFSKDNAYLLVSGLDSPGLFLFDTTDGSQVTFDSTGITVTSTRALDAHPTGNYFLMYLNNQGFVKLHLGTLTTELFSDSGSLDGLRFHPDGLTFACGNGAVVEIRNSSDCSIVNTHDMGGTARVNSVEYSPDGKYLHVGRLSDSGGQTLFTYDEDFNILHEATYSTYQFMSHVGDYLLVSGRQIGSTDAYYILDMPQPKWWNGSEWVDEEVFIVSTDESLSLPSGAWDALA